MSVPLPIFNSLSQYFSLTPNWKSRALTPEPQCRHKLLDHSRLTFAFSTIFKASNRIGSVCATASLGTLSYQSLGHITVWAKASRRTEMLLKQIAVLLKHSWHKKCVVLTISSFILYSEVNVIILIPGKSPKKYFSMRHQ